MVSQLLPSSRSAAEHVGRVGSSQGSMRVWPTANCKKGPDQLITACDAGSASQEDFMKRDEVILVDEQDTMTGSDSKHKAHTFNSEQPRGLLHRAFSVFLFDDDNQLLLQRRANSKITFPGVWTNTCCSHQLHGYEPSEIDSDAEISSGFVPGAKVTTAHHFIMTSCHGAGAQSAQQSGDVSY